MRILTCALSGRQTSWGPSQCGVIARSCLTGRALRGSARPAPRGVSSASLPSGGRDGEEHCDSQPSLHITEEDLFRPLDVPVGVRSDKVRDAQGGLKEPRRSACQDKTPAEGSQCEDTKFDGFSDDSLALLQLKINGFVVIFVTSMAARSFKRLSTGQAEPGSPSSACFPSESSNEGEYESSPRIKGPEECGLLDLPRDAPILEVIDARNRWMEDFSGDKPSCEENEAKYDRLLQASYNTRQDRKFPAEGAPRQGPIPDGFLTPSRLAHIQQLFYLCFVMVLASWDCSLGGGEFTGTNWYKGVLVDKDNRQLNSGLVQALKLACDALAGNDSVKAIVHTFKSSVGAAFWTVRVHTITTVLRLTGDPAGQAGHMWRSQALNTRAPSNSARRASGRSGAGTLELDVAVLSHGGAEDVEARAKWLREFLDEGQKLIDAFSGKRTRLLAALDARPPSASGLAQPPAPPRARTEVGSLTRDTPPQEEVWWLEDRLQELHNDNADATRELDDQEGRGGTE